MTATVAPEVEETERVDPPPWKGRWVLYVIGTLLMAVGIRLVLRNAHNWTPLVDMGEWLVAGVVLHDAVLAPVVIAIGFVLRKALPSPWRGPIVSGLVVSAVLVVVAWPQLRGYKFSADNGTIQPRDYTRGLLLAFAVVWGVVLLTEVAMAVRRRTAGSSDETVAGTSDESAAVVAEPDAEPEPEPEPDAEPVPAPAPEPAPDAAPAARALPGDVATARPGPVREPPAEDTVLPGDVPPTRPDVPGEDA